MKYEINGKIINIPDTEIEKLVSTLEISKDEAIETWLVDNDYETDETVEELTKKAKENRISATIHQAKAEKTDKKVRKPRTKKENPLKKEIIDAIRYYFSDNSNLNFTIDELIVKNDEKYIDFTSNGREFTINLVEHRKKKQFP